MATDIFLTSCFLHSVGMRPAGHLIAISSLQFGWHQIITEVKQAKLFLFDANLAC